MKLQTILIPKTFTRKQATDWLKRHKYKHAKIDITPSYYRFRQIPPDSKKRYQTVTLPNNIKLVYMI